MNRLKVPCFQESLLYNAIRRSLVKSRSQQFSVEGLKRRSSTNKPDLDSELDLMKVFFEWSEYHAKTKRMSVAKSRKTRRGSNISASALEMLSD